MRAALLVALALAGCGNGDGGASSPGVLSASFANFGGANTRGVAISSMFPSCTTAPGGAGLSCTAAEFANGAGRDVSVSFAGAIVAGMDYHIGGPEQANVFFRDPTTFGTAMGERQWQAVAGTGTIHVVSWTPTAHVAFSYAASMQPLGSPAAGTFDLTGDANISAIVAQ
ncbi:MAG TPA: hypothetical protein VF334_13705 [Polyangia bacterium]